MSKYKAGDKFIIEIEDVLTVESGNYKTKDTEYVMKAMNYTTLDGNDLDYLDRYDAGNVWNAGYKTGYDKGYQEGALNPSSIGYEHGYEAGLNDAWECARELVHSRAPEEWDIMCDLFSVERGRQCDIIAKTTASEAIEKLREYEAKKDEIKVGDEVKNELGEKFVVLSENDDGNSVEALSEKGRLYLRVIKRYVTKTGRHFPIEDILEQMRGE